MIIHGDNLEALKALPPEYEGKVDCIYIDPPYLGVFEREHGEGTRLSAMGANIMQKRVRERRLAILGLMFKHEIFHHFFGIMYGNGQLPSTKDIMEQMKLHNMCNEGSTMKRRSSTVKGWLRWIAELPGDDSNEN